MFSSLRLLPYVAALTAFFWLPSVFAQRADPARVQVLFLGDDGHHEPAQRVREILPFMAGRGINVVYTDRLEHLNSETLRRYDVLAMYANHERLSSSQEAALLNYVQDGGGLVAIHCAAAMFGNSDAFISLVGGAFKGHGSGVFQTRTVRADHPAIQGEPEFESWDETYVHMKLNPDAEVLAVRDENGRDEPWTWVRSHGDGRVFYTAWGHDERTWSNPGFRQLLERGMLWAAGDQALAADHAPPALEYEEGLLPYYPSGVGWGITGDPITSVQKPLSPEASMEQAFVEPGFRIELFASEPDIVNPIDMAWDERGRLWIVETIDYPNEFEPERRGSDRIKILEDTDDDGRADKVTVFAEGLNIPTSLTPARGGVIVAQAPDMLFLKDTDGDDRADVKQVLFTGWGTFDTHAGPSSLRYGFDNHVWGAVGYSGFNGAVGGDSIRIIEGLYR
ncbi:MAG: PVC-type heme-binding CxxCH protein, partial [Rhodothermales bacterium]